MATSRSVLKADAINRLYEALMSTRSADSAEQAKAIADKAAHYAEMLDLDGASTGANIDVQRFYASLGLFSVMIEQTPPVNDDGAARRLANKARSFAGFASESVVPDAVLDNLPPAQRRYVSLDGSDTNGNGTIDRPYATIQAAEASITDNSPSKPYVIHLGTGQFTLTPGYQKKTNVHWSGAGGFGTEYGSSVNMGGAFIAQASAVNGSDVLTITNAASMASIFVGMTVSGTGMPTGTIVRAITGPNTVQLSANATANSTNANYNFLGMVIVATAVGDAVTLSNLSLFGANLGGIVVWQTGYKTPTSNATTSCALKIVGCQVTTSVPVNFWGTDHNGNSVNIRNSQLGGQVILRSAAGVIYFTYIPGTITLTENTFQPATSVPVTAHSPSQLSSSETLRPAATRSPSLEATPTASLEA